jgi:enoyl-CoA hydratase/carnithine racemase
VAAISGHAIAGGLGTGTACDTAFAPTRRVTWASPKRVPGSVPAVPMAVVRAELAAGGTTAALLARNLDPEDARLGRRRRYLRPVVPRAYEVARDLATIPGAAYAKIKRQLRAATIARIDHVLATGADPFLNDWLTAETAGAAAALLVETRSRRSLA